MEAKTKARKQEVPRGFEIVTNSRLYRGEGAAMYTMRLPPDNIAKMSEVVSFMREETRKAGRGKIVVEIPGAYTPNMEIQLSAPITGSGGEAQEAILDIAIRTDRKFGRDIKPRC